MKTLTALTLQNLSRREFLRLSGSMMLGALWLPFRRELGLVEETGQFRQGRIASNRALVYDRPSLNAKVLKAFHQDLVLPITQTVVGDGEPAYNRLWYELNGEGYVHSGIVQPVDIVTNPLVKTVNKLGQLAEVSVPFTDARWNLRDENAVAYRLYYSTTHWVVGVDEDKQGKLWYRVFEDKWSLEYYVEPTHLHLITPEEVSPLSPEVAIEEKRLEIHRERQVVIAYEHGRPVFITKTATGAHFSDGDFTTPAGNYITNRKRPSRHMAAGDRAAPNSYDLPGVPWVCYLTKEGISFHGTYWHNDFGRPRSHGCINLSPEAARWVYRWTLPEVPLDETYYEERTGTAVKVI